MSAQLYQRIKLPGSTSKPEIIPPKTYSGFSTVNTLAENYSLYDYELIKQDIMNHFHIRQGERLMQPRFGTIIWDVLFEPMTDTIKALIKDDVTRIINYDPRVQIQHTSIATYESGIQIEFELTYTPYKLTERIKLQFDQANGLV
jgi:phage baseplate assembly protein W